MFHSAQKYAFKEIENRKGLAKKIMRFGIDFLDDALMGILPDDLILLGAPSGSGKTQLCCNIALANMSDGRKIHYIALEAGFYEIERRLKYPLVAERFFCDKNRPRLDYPLSFAKWMMNGYGEKLDAYEQDAAEFFEKAYRDLFLCYKSDKFGISEMIKAVLCCADETDLIIIDHVHYFDLEEENNENKAVKEIAKTARDLSLSQQKPIVLVSHLRKRDKNSEELVAGLDEFHGTSDLYKIATKVITVAPGAAVGDGTYETFFRIPKNRIDGGVTRYIGKEIFSPKDGGYVKGQYRIGSAYSTRKAGFAEVQISELPDWARSSYNISDGSKISVNPRSPFKD